MCAKCGAYTAFNQNSTPKAKALSLLHTVEGSCNFWSLIPSNTHLLTAHIMTLEKREFWIYSNEQNVFVYILYIIIITLNANMEKVQLLSKVILFTLVSRWLNIRFHLSFFLLLYKCLQNIPDFLTEMQCRTVRCCVRFVGFSFQFHQHIILLMDDGIEWNGWLSNLWLYIYS